MKREKALLEAAVSKLEIKNSSEQNLSDEVSSINTTKIKDLEIELQHVKETLSDVALLRKNDLERHVIEVETVRKEKELALAQVRESDSQYATLFSGMVRQLQALVGSCNNAEQVLANVFSSVLDRVCECVSAPVYVFAGVHVKCLSMCVCVSEFKHQIN